MSEPKLPDDFQPTEVFQCSDCAAHYPDAACGFDSEGYDKCIYDCSHPIHLPFAQKLAACYNAFHGLPIEAVLGLGKPEITTDRRGRLVVRFVGPDEKGTR